MKCSERRGELWHADLLSSLVAECRAGPRHQCSDQQQPGNTGGELQCVLCHSSSHGEGEYLQSSSVGQHSQDRSHRTAAHCSIDIDSEYLNIKSDRHTPSNLTGICLQSSLKKVTVYRNSVE